MIDSVRAAILDNLAAGGTPCRPLATVLVLRAGVRDLVAAGASESRAEAIVRLRGEDAAVAEAARAAALGARIATPGSGIPPELIGHPYCPSVLYLRGAALPPEPRVALVGARSASSSMVRFAERIGFECARHGISVVSGLARGIDAAAHRGALLAKGLAVGVLGCGVDVVYPPDTRDLHRAVLESGTLVSTFPLGMPPLQFHFPLRNRLIAALSRAVVVVQARKDSGSMSTARAALDAGIDVLAVPGSPDDPLAEGTNRLIRDGAPPVLAAEDVIEAVLGIGMASPRPSPAASDEPSVADPILTEIGSVARTPDQIAAATGMRLEQVLVRLVDLELAGRVTREPGGAFRLWNPLPVVDSKIP